MAGGIAGLTAVLLTSTVTRHELLWHSFVLEALFCATAGWWLVKLHGGMLKGLVMFGAAYLLAFFLRAAGLDPSVVFAPSDIDLVGATSGNMTSLCFLLGIGGLFGHIFEGLRAGRRAV